MKHSTLTLLTGAALTVVLLASCRGKVTISGNNGTDTLEFNTDSIREININVQTTNTTTGDTVAQMEGELKINKVEEEN